MSATVPNASLVAGSDTPVTSCNYMLLIEEKLTEYREGLSICGIGPFAVDETFGVEQTGVLESGELDGKGCIERLVSLREGVLTSFSLDIIKMTGVQ